MPDVTLTVNVDGALFNGRAAHELAAFVLDAKREVGAQAYADVMTILNARIQHPTPYYETQVITQTVGNDVVTHDRGIIYGPWLEGTSSRNQSTRFKGYHAFREASQQVTRKAGVLIARVLARHIGRMQ